MVTGGRGSGAGSDTAQTSVHVRRAEAGDLASLAWIVDRFSPLLLAQAAHRLGPRLRTHCDPEDLVNDVWAIALPRLAELGTRDGRHTPVLARFLSTTLLFRVNKLARKGIAGALGDPAAGAPAGTDGSAPDDPVAALPALTSGVVSKSVRKEIKGAVATAIAELEPQDREIIVLRGIEQTSNKTAAMVLGLTEKAVSMRYRRALDRLRMRLPGSIFDELADEPRPGEEG